MEEKLKERIEKSESIVFFGGAGVSTESGIPDFRSENGLYQAQQAFGRSPEELLSHSFFMEHKETFFDYYKHYLIYPEVRPNSAHLALATLETQGKLTAVITQNIDGLHQLAGSKQVLELHGSVLRNYCMDCGGFYHLDYIMAEENCRTTQGEAAMTPHCKACGGVVKPDVVLYEEALNHKTLNQAVEAISSCDTLIVGGTSLVVYPAAGLIEYFQGKQLILINKAETPYDSRADLVIREPIGSALRVLLDN